MRIRLALLIVAALAGVGVGPEKLPPDINPVTQ